MGLTVKDKIHGEGALILHVSMLCVAKVRKIQKK